MVRSVFDSSDECFFATLVTDESELRSAVLLVESKRAFAGALSGSCFLVFTTIEVGEAFSDFPEAGIFVIESPDKLAGCLFGEKVSACQLAEEKAQIAGKTLIWIDPCCLLLRQPSEFLIKPSYKAAFPPVHITNVGQRVHEPLSEYWRKIYEATGNQLPDFSIESFIDGEEILPYFNSHCFSLDPSIGLCANWLMTLEKTWNDPGQSYLLDNSHRVFLFQAVLSAVVTSQLHRDEIRILSPDYSYPYHLQAKVPSEKRVQWMNELTCVVYEEESLHPGGLRGLKVDEPLASWLNENVKVIR
jgi:hypothetical protein